MKNNKTVIITGGGTGIGKGIALKLAKNNFNIILASRNISNLQKVKEEIDQIAKVEMDPKFEGRQMIMVLAPR